MSEKVIMVIDAGGTKTKAALINCIGKIVYEEVGPCGSPAVIKEQAITNIFQLVKKVLEKSEYLVTYIQMGISGLGVIADKNYFEQQLANEVQLEVSMENDVVLALNAVMKNGTKAMAVVSGTGSACGAIVDDKVYIDGGWGHMLTEDGSGYMSVKMLLDRMIKAYEETAEISVLGQAFLDEIGITNIHHLRSFAHFNNKFYIASFSKFISEMAKNNNQEALCILEDCGIALAKRVARLYKKANLTNCDLGLFGSFVSKAFKVKETLIDYLQKLGYNPNVVMIGEDPIYGGYYMAKRKGKI